MRFDLCEVKLDHCDLATVAPLQQAIAAKSFQYL